MDGRAEIHSEDPFATPVDQRVPVRRLRGRLVAPVTIWTSGPPGSRAGLTVSSLLVAEGEPSLILGLVNDTTDLWDRISETGTFVVHVLGEDQRRVAEVFAGLRPSPGGVFESVSFEDGPYGPLLTDFPTRAYCRFVGESQEGYHRLVRGTIEAMDLGDDTSPLVHHRGAFHALRD